MTKNIESRYSENPGMNMNEAGNSVSYPDFGSNEIVVYRKKGMGAAIVTSLWILIALGFVLSITSIFLFSKSVRISRDAIAKNNELIALLKEESVVSEKVTDVDKGIDNDVDESESIAQEEPEEESKKESKKEPEKEKSEITDVSGKEDKLTSLKMVASEGASVESNCQNTVGDTFDRAVVCKDYFDTHVTYYLNGEYSTLSVDVSTPEHHWVSEKPYAFEVFANNDESNVLFSTTLSRVSAAQHLDIDVSGVEFITFRATYDGSSQYPSFILSDGVLSRE